MKELLLGIFSHTDQIESVIEDLTTEGGVALQEISVILREYEDKDQSYLKNIDLVDAVVGSKIGIQPVSVPEVGDIYLGGPIARKLGVSGEEGVYDPAATIIGPLAGGMVNALMDMEVGEEDAVFIQEALKAGKILLGVEIGENAKESAQKIFEKHKGTHILAIGG